MLTESELNEIEVLLAMVEGEDFPLPLDGLHGYLSALAITGHPPAPDAWLGWVLNPSGNGQPPAADSPQGTRIADLLTKLLGNIEADFDDPDYHFSPVLRVYPGGDHERPDAGVWGAGFVRGIEHGGTRWQQFLDVSECEALLRPIYRLADAGELRSLAVAEEDRRNTRGKPPSARQREAMSVELPHTLEAIAQAFVVLEIDQTLGEIDRGAQEPAWRLDELCPCGSGRWFQQCCARDRVLH